MTRSAEFEQTIGQLVCDLSNAAAEIVEQRCSNGACRLKCPNDRKPAICQKELECVGIGRTARKHSDKDDRILGCVDQASCFGERLPVGWAEARKGWRR